MCRRIDETAYKAGLINRDENIKAEPGNELDTLICRINELIEGDYSQAVFNKYSVNKPVLIRIHTGEEIQWRMPLGILFDRTTIGQRHSLVGLIEDGGKYRFK